MVIDPPEVGGELILYDGLPAELTTPKKELDLENYQQRRYNPQAGDLTIFHFSWSLYLVCDFGS
ncbi:MAG: hypothetical protein MGU50_05755 [Trichodesmium sp. MAG_R02]|jgi:hypothetical protein|nr:hypothetical protein [Trichodesmium sp. MAG_R02]